MKIGTAEHPKTYDLAARIDAPIPLVLGYLELLWQFTAQHCPQGNIGKWSDAAIARACQAVLSADLDASKFVDALTKSGFLDQSDEHRLVVHDWRDHAPAWVAAKLKREGKDVFLGETVGCDLDDTKPHLSEDLGGTSNQAKPSQAKNSEGAGAPHADLQNLYHEILPELPPIRKWTDKRAKAFRARWRDPQYNNLDFWRRYFEHVRTVPFLMGKNDRGWQADIDFLLREEKIVKAMEGGYERIAND